MRTIEPILRRGRRVARRPGAWRALAAGGALAAALGCSGGGPSSPSPRPSPAGALLVSVDTLRADRLGAYGDPGATSTHMDRLSRRSTLFSDASAAVPITAPSHATLFTGRYPPEHGLRSNGGFRLPDGATTLAELAKGRGFATMAVVGGAPLVRSSGLAQGFDAWDDRLSGEGGPAVERTAREVVDLAIAQLDGRRAGASWLLFTHFYDPHDAYDPPPELRALGLPPYDGEVAAVDEQLGRLFARVGREGDPAIVLLSDHGEGLGDHGEPTHTVFVYQSTLHVPLLIAARRGAAAIATIPVGLVDVAPTMAELLGLPPLPQAAGASLAAVLRGGSSGLSPRRPLYFESILPELNYGWAPLHGVRLGEWKLIEAPRPELYRMDEDPGETVDLGADAAARPSGEQASAALSSLRAQRWPGGGAAAAAVTTAEDRARLEALGYLGAGAAPSPGTAGAPAGADPKDRVRVLQKMDEALALTLAGRHAEAEAACREALADDPGNAILLKQLGVMLARQGRRDEARDVLAQAAERSHGVMKSDVLVWRANVALSAGDAAGAERDAEAALAAEPGSPVATAMVAKARARAKEDADREAATARAEAALAAAPDDPGLQRAAGEQLLREGKPGEAIAHLDRARAARPADVELLRLAAEAHAASGDPAGAARILDERLGAAPDDWQTAYAREVLRSRTGELEAAAAGLRRLATAHPEAAEIWNALGTALARQGRLADAVEAYRTAVARNPGSRAYQENLARAEAAAGRGAAP